MITLGKKKSGMLLQWSMTTCNAKTMPRPNVIRGTPSSATTHLSRNLAVQERSGEPEVAKTDVAKLSFGGSSYYPLNLLDYRCGSTADQKQTVRREKNDPDRKSTASLAKVLKKEKRSRRGVTAWGPVAEGTAPSSSPF